MHKFSKNQRLITQAEYQAVFDHSHKVRDKFLLALFKKNQQSVARLGLVITKRNVKNAVNRNKIKRVVRESFRLHQEKLTGLDIVIIARHDCGTQNKTDLRESIDQLWKKLINYWQNLSL